MGPAERHLPQLAHWARETGLELELLNQPSTDWGEAANLGLGQARAPVVLFWSAHLVPPPDLLARLAGHFGDSSVAAVGGSLQAGPEAPAPARLAALDFVFRSADPAGDLVPVLWSHCAAFDRRRLLQVGAWPRVRAARAHPCPPLRPAGRPGASTGL